MIDGVIAKELILRSDERGRLMEILRADDESFQEFGQVYLTTVYPGIVKAWHYHKNQADNFACIKGKIRLGLYDAREDSKTKGKVQEFLLSLEKPILVRIPQRVYHGFENAGNEEAVIINIPTKPYDRKNPDEYRLDPFNNDIPFKWNSKIGW